MLTTLPHMQKLVATRKSGVVGSVVK